MDTNPCPCCSHTVVGQGRMYQRFGYQNKPMLLCRDHPRYKVISSAWVNPFLIPCGFKIGPFIFTKQYHTAKLFCAGRFHPHARSCLLVEDLDSIPVLLQTSSVIVHSKSHSKFPWSNSIPSLIPHIIKNATSDPSDETTWEKCITVFTNAWEIAETASEGQQSHPSLTHLPYTKGLSCAACQDQYLGLGSLLPAVIAVQGGKSNTK